LILKLRLPVTTQICDIEKEKSQSVYRASVKFISIFFPTGNSAFQTQYPYILLSRLLLACCFSAEDSKKTATKQQQNSKPIRSWKESGMASIDHFMF
jgi:hypothetical protein